MPSEQVTVHPPPAKRPRDRKSQIERSAGDLFARDGFHAVRMEDIATQNGITPRALYRHFASKEELLSAIVTEGQTSLLAALMALGDGPVSIEELAQAFQCAAPVGFQLGPLWQREARHLSTEHFREVRDRLRAIASIVTRVVAQQSPELDGYEAEFRGWAIVSILTSPAHDDGTRVQQRRPSPILIPACQAVASGPDSVRPVAALTAGLADPPDGRYLSSRREQIIRAAAREFRIRGYGGVSLDEFGSNIGIAGPAVYRYFDGKPDLLAVTISRFHEWVAHESMRAVSETGDDALVLQQLVSGYIRVALEATDLLAVGVSEPMYLPAEAATRCRKIRADHLNEWVLWLEKKLPKLDIRSARILANAARVTIDDLVRIRHLRQAPQFPELLNSCALAILGIGH